MSIENKKVIYFEPVNYERDMSHEEMLKLGMVFARVWLVDEITGEEWGDDWNDRPSYCNSGPPYEDTCKGLEIRELKYGQIL